MQREKVCGNFSLESTESAKRSRSVSSTAEISTPRKGASGDEAAVIVNLVVIKPITKPKIT